MAVSGAVRGDIRSGGPISLPETGPINYEHAKTTKAPLFPAEPFRFGGAKRDRTADLYNAIVALSQLSYSPETSGLPQCRCRYRLA